MPTNLTGKKLGIIHAALITNRVVQRNIDKVIPEVDVIHRADDTIRNTDFACAPDTIRPGNHAKIAQAALSQQSYGAVVRAQLAMSELKPRLTATKVPVYYSGRKAFKCNRELLKSKA
jgi:hypothetical protein